MSGRQIYAHWLDPDYLGKYVIPKRQIDERTREYAGYLKFHAIAGDCILISDVQLVESRALLMSFADKDFQVFLEQHPDFLRLKGQSTEQFGAMSPKLGTICNGLARIVALGESYIPNTFNSAALIPAVANLFMGKKSETDAQELFRLGGKLRQLLSRCDEADRSLVDGLFHALEYFVTNSDAVDPIRGGKNRRTYYDELEEALSNVPKQSRVRTSLEETIALAKSKDERFSRSKILAKLPNANEIGHPDRSRYLTAAQAWNVAVGRTLVADCDSAYCFRGVFPIPVHSGLTLGRATIIVHMGQEDEMFSTLPRYDWHPSELSWGTISKIRSAYRANIRKYQDSLLDIDAPLGYVARDTPESNFRAVASVAGKIIAQDRCKIPPMPAPLWMSPVCTLAKYIEPEVGAVLGPHLSSVVFGALSHPLTKWFSLAPAAYSLVRMALIRGDAQKIGECLEEFGLQYNLHRASSRSVATGPSSSNAK
jgi:hypothetical protein